MSVQPTSPAQADSSGDPNRLALGFILISVVSYGLIPPIIGYIGGGEIPFLFLTAWRAGVAVSCAAILIVFYLPLWLDTYNWRRFKFQLSNSKTAAVDWHLPLVNRRLKNLLGREELRIYRQELRIPLVNWKIPGDFIDWRILVCILGNCEYALFAWSLRYIDITVSTILFQSWVYFNLILTIMMLILREDEGQDKNKNGKTTLSYMLLVGLGFIGFAFVIASQKGELGELGDVELRRLVIGIGLALGAMTLGILKNSGIDWARNLGAQLSDISGSIERLNRSPQMFFVLVSFMISSLGAAVIGVVVGFGSGESLDMELIGQAFLYGMIINGTAGILWRNANMDENNKSYNALGFATPILSLVFLFWFGLAGFAEDVDYLILGVMAIVVANLLINFEAEVRWSFESLILALGGCGTLVYFREVIIEEWLNIPKWGWTGDGYFAAIGMTATVFTLLLAFRVARLITRTNDEQNRTFTILRKLDHLAKRDVIHRDEYGDVRDCILEIDRTNKQPILRYYYQKARGYINKATPESQSDRDTLIQVEADLDMLVRSQQQTPVLGEIFALLVFAGITIFLTMFTIPAIELEGWIKLFLDMFAMLVSAVIIFLMAYSLDLDRERDAHVLEQPTEEGEYLLRFPEIEVRLFDQWLSVAVGVIIILVYAGLLAHKHEVLKLGLG